LGDRFTDPSADRGAVATKNIFWARMKSTSGSFKAS
jgi:hypothetical protein